MDKDFENNCYMMDDLIEHLTKFRNEFGNLPVLMAISSDENNDDLTIYGIQDCIIYKPNAAPEENWCMLCDVRRGPGPM